MKILAIDPGSVSCRYALLERGSAPARARYVSSGAFEANLACYAALLESRERPGLVAIEKPSGFVHEHVRGAHLLATAGVAYALEWVAADRAIDVVVMSAAEVRKMMLGKSKLAFGRGEKKGDMDRLIARVLPNFVDGLPARTNQHVRDAMLLGVAANWRRLAADQAKGAA